MMTSRPGKASCSTGRLWVEYSDHRPVRTEAMMRTFDVFLIVTLEKLLYKRSSWRWLLCRLCDVTLYSVHSLLIPLQWRHNERYGVSNRRRLDGLLNRLITPRSRKTSKIRVTGLREGNSPLTGEFTSQRASNAENVSIWWRHYGTVTLSRPADFLPTVTCIEHILSIQRCQVIKPFTWR